MDGQTVLTNPTEYGASAISTGTKKELSEVKAMMKHLADSVISQLETVATLSNKMNGGSSGSGKTIDKKKARPGLHVCAHCK